MSPVTIAVITGLVLLVGFLIYTSKAATSMEGTSAEQLLEIFPELAEHEAALVYCYTEACGPCKRMLPEIEAMQKDQHPVFKLDVRQHFSISRRCGIRATPTILLIRDRIISKVEIGMKSRSALETLLKS